MKKISILAVILAILLTLSTVAMADDNAITLSDAHVREDETIYLTLRLHKSIIGDAVGISYTFDSAVLEPVLSSCAWSQKGALSNFNKENSGVWAANKANDLAGDICVLAFRVKDGVKLTETTVSCSLVIKNGAVEQGTFTAQAIVTYDCSHSYGPWEPGNEAGHIKTCIHCSGTAYQPHSWNSPETEENAEDPDHDWLVYTCKVCGFALREEISKIAEDMKPLQSTEPTTTVTIPSMPTMPPETQPAPSVPSASTPNNPSYPNTGAPVGQIYPTLPHQETLHRDPQSQPDPEIHPSTEPENNDSESGTQPKNDETEPTTQPTYPDNSSNFTPRTEPTMETTASAVTTAPTTPYNDYNSEAPQTTLPHVMPVKTESTPQSTTSPNSENRDHTAEPVIAEAEGNPIVNAVMIATVLIVSVGGVNLYLKKKRK